MSAASARGVDELVSIARVDRPIGLVSIGASIALESIVQRASAK